MATVKCKGCDLTISYTCDKATVLAGFQLPMDKNNKSSTPEENKKKLILTLECFNGHRNNYEDLCEK